MSTQLDNPEIPWSRRPKAEAELILAQFMVEMQQEEEAGRLLFSTLPDVRDRELRARGFFLNGQILELSEAYEAAYEAFDRAASANPHYELIYHAELKKGIMLRNMGQYEDARRHFSAMARDNNNFEFLTEIQYQLGRTHHAMGDAEKAKEWFE